MEENEKNFECRTQYLNIFLPFSELPLLVKHQDILTFVKHQDTYTPNILPNRHIVSIAKDHDKNLLELSKAASSIRFQIRETPTSELIRGTLSIIIMMNDEDGFMSKCWITFADENKMKFWSWLKV